MKKRYLKIVIPITIAIVLTAVLIVACAPDGYVAGSPVANPENIYETYSGTITHLGQIGGATQLFYVKHDGLKCLVVTHSSSTTSSCR